MWSLIPPRQSRFGTIIRFDRSTLGLTPYALEGSICAKFMPLGIIQDIRLPMYTICGTFGVKFWIDNPMFSSMNTKEDF